MESIIEGNWSGGMPEEMAHAILMKEYGWSWDQLMETPPYVQRVCMDFLQITWAHERDEMDRTRRHAEQQRQQAGGR